MRAQTPALAPAMNFPGDVKDPTRVPKINIIKNVGISTSNKKQLRLLLF